jgi:PEP-CTERM motif
MNRFSMVVCLVAAGVLSVWAETSCGENVSLNFKKIKFDYIPQSQDGGLTFGGDSTFPALPADFFDPGSEPFEGRIDLSNVPGSGTAMPTFRTSGTNFPEPIPAGGTEDINIGVGELNLMSAQPISVNYSDGSTELWDAEVHLDPSQVSEGVMRVTHNPDGDPDGGTIVPLDSFFDIAAEVTFSNTPPGQATRYRGFYIIDRTNLTTTDALWAHQNNNIAGGADRDFIPGADPADPSAPLQVLFFDGGGLDLPLQVVDVVPEPSTLLLAIAGFVGLIAVRRRRSSDS